MMVFDRTLGRAVSSRFTNWPDLLRCGDLVVVNDTRVIPARLRGRKDPGGGQVEILLLQADAEGRWWVLLRPGKRVRAGTGLRFPGSADAADDLEAEVIDKLDDGRCLLGFSRPFDVLPFAERHGEVPLPPYIERASPDPADRERYQTVYAQVPGSVAAPTAGLHLTEGILAEMRERGVGMAAVTLHVGLGTFAPVKADDVAAHAMHWEEYSVPESTAELVAAAKREGRRVVAVGTTTLRVLESAARAGNGEVRPGSARTNLFLYPPASFTVVDALLTNFHLPRSTLLMLVCAFASPGETRGVPAMLSAYRQAVDEEYRFFSYGDAMWIH